MHGDHKSSKHRELMEKVREVKEKKAVFSISSFVARYENYIEGCLTWIFTTQAEAKQRESMQKERDAEDLERQVC